MDCYSIKIQTLLQIEKRKWVFLVGLVALTHLFCQSLMLPYGNALRSLIPNEKISRGLLKASESSKGSSIDETFDKFTVLTLEKNSLLLNEASLGGDSADDEKDSSEKDKVEKINSGLDVDAADDDFNFLEDETLGTVNVAVAEGLMLPGDVTEANKTLPEKNIVRGSDILSPPVVSAANPLIIKAVVHNESYPAASSSSNDIIVMFNETAFANSTLVSNKPVGKKIMRCNMPPKTVTPIDEMQRLLVHHRARSRAMRPRWSSDRDREILAAKLKIENPPILKNDRELYPPLFRNISMFKRSYELMERVLKIYVYKDGERPIFHRPILKGLYASEGWFMKLMEGNKRFTVKDPRKAHLFYMPFSSRMLEYTLYVRNSHNRTNLRQYLKDYSEKIAAKYRYWNRTGGADHFLVACHDWAPYETRHHMEHCIKALCNADVTLGFKIGRDVSLPETYVRSARNPLRDLGGKPPSQRRILAFYAGNMHGYLRTILLKHWKDREPDMKILGPMPPGVASKMNYISHMKNSRYCICPKGYEVNSPRIVEAIFYECVPVIISDNFVPPFFEVLNWDTFSLIVAEKDIPKLREILVSVPEQKYLAMQLGVRRAQQHFLWHSKPMKYDLFHMTLHSIWYNRVFQIKNR
ncbi:probable glycosyltransferase At3g07620 [Andrographis paniculata]|uniref:probable glycosyltransferase At3g07620 n=1 Tax=Andrographis paniculata TaxID=175694 RepID=UPI0021E7C34C|nr:probable glycosyltransferase At3g07620 [Andrographis paniculata]XP_051131765.1 probable glycosyltransferase At3g07620 [Andrographis paniculata]